MNRGGRAAGLGAPGPGGSLRRRLGAGGTPSGAHVREWPPEAGAAPAGGRGRRGERGGERKERSRAERDAAPPHGGRAESPARPGRETGKSPAFSPQSEDEAGREGKRKRGRRTEAPWMRSQRRKASQRRRGEKARTSSTWGAPRRCRHFSERTKLPTRKARAGKRGGGKGGGKETSTNLRKAGGRRLPVAPRTGASPFPASQGSCSRPGPAALGPGGLPREKQPLRPPLLGGGAEQERGQASPQPLPCRTAGQAGGAAPRQGKESSLSGNGAFSVVNF